MLFKKYLPVTVSVILGLSTFFSPFLSAQAQTIGEALGSGSNSTSTPDSSCPTISDPSTMINGYSVGGLCFLYEKIYGIDALTKGNLNIYPTTGQVTTNAQPPTRTFINNTLDNTQKNATKNLRAGVQAIPVPGTTKTQNNAPDPGLASLDMHSLIGKWQYAVPPAQQQPNPIQAFFGRTSQPSTQITEQQLAQNFITALSVPGLTPSALDFVYSDGSPYTPEAITEILNDAVVAKYMTELRAYTAQMATGIGYLNRLLTERTIVPNLAQNAGITQDEAKSMANSFPDIAASWPNASPLAIKHYLATQRINDTQWYANLASASPAQLQRQMLLLLAEMRAEMFEQTQEIKRLNATMSILVIQNANTSTVMMQTDQGNAQKKINDNPK